MAEFVIVGSNDCPVVQMVNVLRYSAIFPQFHENWFDLATSLEIPMEKIKKLKYDFTVNVSNLHEILLEVIYTWVSQEGSEATLDGFLMALNLNKLKEPAELLHDKYVGSKCYTKYRKFSRVSKEIDSFLATENICNVCIVRTIDSRVTCTKLKEIVKNLCFYAFDDFLKFISSEHFTPNKIYVITDTTVGDILGLLAEIRQKQIDRKTKLVVLIHENDFKEVNPVLPDDIKILEDNMKWNDLTLAFKHEIRKGLAEIVKIEENTENGLLTGDALVNLINGDYSSLVKSSIPALGNLYIRRKLITRNILDIKQMSTDDASPDLYVFTGISKLELCKYFPLQSISNSKLQLQKITSKFIILDHVSHYNRIIYSLGYKQPVHWIDYQNNKFFHRKSTGSIKQIQFLLDNSQGVYSEDEFLDQLEKLPEKLPICISDSPGMGKSFLLLSLGRNLSTKCFQRRVFILVFSHFINQIVKHRKVASVDLEIAIKSSLQTIICNNELEKAILVSQLDSKGLTVELMLDGMDEVNPSYLKLALDSIKIITTWHSTRLWISTRSHLLNKLEEAAGTLGYNIRPFAREDQISFLQSYWTASAPTSTDSEECCNVTARVTHFTEQCLTSLEESTPINDKDIPSIPLHCLLIGEVYKDDVQKNCLKQHDSDIRRAPQIIDSAELYFQLIDKKCDAYINQKDSFISGNLSRDKVLLAHAEPALRIIFPAQHHLLSKYFSPRINDLLKVGILEKTSTTTEPVFLHRNFAKYIVARFVVNLLLNCGKKEDKNVNLFFKELFRCNTTPVNLLEADEFRSASFIHPNVLYFLDWLIAKTPSLVDLNTNIILENSLQNAVKACAHHSFVNLLNVFMRYEEITKQPYKFYKNLLLLSGRNSNFNVLSLSFSLLETQKITVSQELLIKVLRLIVIGGNVTGFQYLCNSDKYREQTRTHINSRKTLLYDCVENSYNDSAMVIRNKTKIIQLLLDFNATYLEYKDNDEKIGILCESIHQDLLKFLINKGIDLQAHDKNYNTILHIVRPPLQFHKMVLSIPPDISQRLVHKRNIMYDTPLQTLLRHQDPLPETLETFKTLNADFNLTGNKDSVLSLAIKSGRTGNSIYQLVECGADVSWKKGCKRKTLLHIAAQCGNLSAMKCLIIKYRMCLTQKDRIGNTPMDYLQNFLRSKKIKELTKSEIKQFFEEATENSSPPPSPTSRKSSLYQAVIKEDFDTIKMFIELGRDVDEYGNSPLHFAAENGKNSLVKRLLQQKANLIDAQDNYGLTPLHIAAKFGHYSVVTTLVKCNADVNIQGVYGFTPLHFAAMSTKAENSKIIKYLVDNKALIDIQDSQGRTPFHFAAREIEYSTLKFLVESGSNPNIQNKDGWTPIHRAAGKNNYERVQLLVSELGANINIQNNDGETALHFAARNGHYLTLKHLLILGASLNIQNNSGDTSLHLAVARDHVSIVKLLIDHGADQNVRNTLGSTPFDLAAQEDNSSTDKFVVACMDIKQCK